MSAFSVHVAALEAEVFTRLGTQAAWTGIADPVWVILKENDVDIDFGPNKAQARACSLAVRKVEVLNPVSGQVVEFEGRTFRVMGRPRLDRKGVWRCEVVEL